MVLCKNSIDIPPTLNIFYNKIVFLLLPLGVVATIGLFILLLLRVICVFPWHRLSRPALIESGRHIFNVRSEFSACCWLQVR